jgi:hypothetical protein
MGGGGGQGAAPVVASKPASTTLPPNPRKDPFKPWWSTTPPPPNPLTIVAPPRIAIYNTAAETKPPGIEIQEVPNRRVAGILTGTGVYALIDDNNGTGKVVKPGDDLDGYRVAAINADSVVLKRTVDNRTYTQVVPLTDVGSSTTFAGPAAGAPGGPGLRGGGGIPGMPRGGGGKLSGGGGGAAE